MSTLRIEPRELVTTGGYGPKTYWKVSLDDGRMWEAAKPFSASADRIILSECLECYQCGSPSTLVRRTGDAVLWIRSPDPRVEPELSYGEAVAFSLDEYEQSLSLGSALDLPELLPCEIIHELRHQALPIPNTALYRVPDSEKDPFGAGWLYSVVTAMESLNESVHAVGAPHDYVEIRIGIESPGIPEAISRVGILGGAIAIEFVTLPHFPLWLTWDRLADAVETVLLPN